MLQHPLSRDLDFIISGSYCAVMLQHPLSRDLEIISEPQSTPRQRIAARLTKIEKSILQDCLGELRKAMASGMLGQAGPAAAVVDVEPLPSSEVCEAALRGSSIRFT
jgi:hypothetical protein